MEKKEPHLEKTANDFCVFFKEVVISTVYMFEMTWK